MFSSSRLCGLLSAASLLAAHGAASAQFTLNDTGVAICGNGSAGGQPKPLIPCEGTAQDGALGRDTAFPDDSNGSLGFEFVAVCNSGLPAGVGTCPAAPEVGPKTPQWRCTFDNVTGLLWEIKLTGDGPFGSGTRFTNALPGQVGYGGAKDASGLALKANQLALCGRTDWRLPERAELLSLVHYGQFFPPLIDEKWFPNTDPAAFWSNTDGNAAASRQPSPNNAWGINMAIGDLWHTRRTEKNRVRLVAGNARNPTPPDATRFKISEDGTEVFDRSTRLIWRRCSEGQSMDTTCTGEPALIPREKVLNRVWATGWRLPNIKELNSIVDTNFSYPAHDPALFPNAYEEGSYWTSSLKAGSGYLWFVGIGTGSVVYTRHPSGAVRLVRDGPAP